MPSINISVYLKDEELETYYTNKDKLILSARKAFFDGLYIALKEKK